MFSCLINLVKYFNLNQEITNSYDVFPRILIHQVELAILFSVFFYIILSQNYSFKEQKEFFFFFFFFEQKIMFIINSRQ